MRMWRELLIFTVLWQSNCYWTYVSKTGRRFQVVNRLSSVFHLFYFNVKWSFLKLHRNPYCILAEDSLGKMINFLYYNWNNMPMHIIACQIWPHTYFKVSVCVGDTFVYFLSEFRQGVHDKIMVSMKTQLPSSWHFYILEIVLCYFSSNPLMQTWTYLIYSFPFHSFPSLPPDKNRQIC